jgi:formate dehydrogenase subunit gamma
MSESAEEQQATAARKIASAHAGTPGGLLPVLHEIQDRFGFISDSAARAVAAELNLSRAEVHGVLTFYHLFRRSPPGKRTIYLCRAEACQAMGARELERHVKDKLAIDFHQTTQDRRFSLEPIYCLGNCACSPAIMIDDAVHGRVTTSRFDELLNDG